MAEAKAPTRDNGSTKNKNMTYRELVHRLLTLDEQELNEEIRLVDGAGCTTRVIDIIDHKDATSPAKLALRIKGALNY